MVSACLIGQFGPILWGETSDGAHFFLVRANKKKKGLGVLEHLKKLFFIEKYMWNTKNFKHLQLLFFFGEFSDPEQFLLS